MLCVKKGEGTMAEKKLQGACAPGKAIDDYLNGTICEAPEEPEDIPVPGATNAECVATEIAREEEKDAYVDGAVDDAQYKAPVEPAKSTAREYDGKAPKKDGKIDDYLKSTIKEAKADGENIPSPEDAVYEVGDKDKPKEDDSYKDFL